MTQGGPKNATKTMVYYIYTQGFQKGNFGYACAIAAVFFVISREGSTGKNVAMEFMLAKILASGLREAEIIQISGETKMSPMTMLPA